MAKYTMELRKVCEYYSRDEVENWFKSYRVEDALTPEQISVLTKFNVWSKEKLAEMIVDHYYMREIGFETPALFRHYALVTMNEIMPRYLLKIYTQFLEYDPLSSVDYTEEYTREIESEASSENQSSGTSNSTSSGTSNSSTSETSNSTSNDNASNLTINNTTPQSRISKQNLENGIYASSTTQTDSESEISSNTQNEISSNNENEISGETTNSSEGSSSSENKTVEKYTHTMKGDNGVIVTNQYLVREFRELAVSFNEEIINELSSLFMGLY